MLAGLVRLYRATGQRQFLEWTKRQFDGMLLHLCSETGWTQEFMPWQSHKGGASCETVVPLYRHDVKTIAATYNRSPAWPGAIGEIEW